MFKKLDEILQEKIRDEKLWDFYNKDCYIDIDGTKQEIINVNIRSNAKDKAIENLQKEIENLKIENQKLINQNIQFQNTTFSKRVKRTIKKLVGGSNG